MALLEQVLGYVVNQSQAGVPAQTQASASTPPGGLPNLSPVAKGVMLVLAAKAWQAYSAQRAAGGAASAQASGGLGSFGAGGLLGPEREYRQGHLLQFLRLRSKSRSHLFSSNVLNRG